MSSHSHGNDYYICTHIHTTEVKARIWRNQVLLVGMITGVATMKNRMEVPPKINNIEVPCALSLSHVQFFANPWTIAHQALSKGILQSRILEWVAMPSSEVPYDPGISLLGIYSRKLKSAFQRDICSITYISEVEAAQVCIDNSID